jgi:hypothetical protein
MPRSIIAIAFLLAATACSQPAEQPPTIGEVVTDIPGDLNEAIAEIRELFSVRYDNLGELYLALRDLRLGPNIAILYDRTGRLEGEGLGEDLAAYEEFIGSILLSVEALDAAVAAEDLPDLNLAWLRMELAAGTLAIRTSPGSCPTLAPPLTRDLCRTPGLDGYEDRVDFVIKAFLSRYRPVVRLPEAFGSTIRSQAVADLSAEVVLAIDSTVDDLGDLEVPNPYVGVHEAFIEHLRSIRPLWDEIDLRGQSDPLLWGFLADSLEEVACRSLGPYLEGRALLLSAVPGTSVVDLAELWLHGEATGCSR